MIFPDVDTLRLCSILASTAFGFVFAVLWLRNRQALHLACWAASSLLYGGAILCFALLPDASLPVVTLLYAVLGVTDVLPLAGVRMLGGRSMLRPWMIIPVVAPAVGHVLPPCLAQLGVIAPTPQAQTIGDAVGLIVAMGGPGLALAFGEGARQSAGRRMAGFAMLGYLPAYLFSIVGEFTVLPGAELVALLAMLSDQLLLGVLNLGLLAVPVEQVQRELRDAARRDALTGCWNRAGLAVVAERFLQAGATVIALDVDHFKQINDRLGHAAGDDVLRCIGRDASALAARHGGEAVRLGGDEFLVLLPARAQAAPQFVQRLQERFAQDRALASDWSVSFGVAVVLEEDGALATAMARADSALYQAKRSRQPRLAAA